MVPLIVLMFWIGIYPKPYLRLMESGIANTLESLQKPAQVTELL